MRILILTHPLETNYGGILQNYALQITLRRLGHEVITIDYHTDKSILYKTLSYISRLLRHFVLRQKDIPTTYSINRDGKDKLVKNPEIQRFINNYIKKTKYISSRKRLKKVLELKPECIIVGSDQVWQKEFVPTSFLDFARNYDCLKIAYAASGNIDWMRNSHLLPNLKHLICGFNAISVREETNILKSKKILNMDACYVLDPVFLAEKKDYLDLTYGNEQYHRVLTSYILDPTHEKCVFIDNIATIKKLKVNPTTSGEMIYDIPALESWMSAIAYSDYIITDSFHGMVLSIVFNKEFIVISNSKRGKDRFHSVLDKLHLNNRLIDEDKLNIEKIINLHPIDYTQINKIIKHDKETSINFLKDNIIQTK